MPPKKEEKKVVKKVEKQDPSKEVVKDFKDGVVVNPTIG